jgi:hypothetical protein
MISCLLAHALFPLFLEASQPSRQSSRHHGQGGARCVARSRPFGRESRRRNHNCHEAKHIQSSSGVGSVPHAFLAHSADNKKSQGGDEFVQH